jgi:hypothetical protein
MMNRDRIEELPVVEPAVRFHELPMEKRTMARKYR